MHLIVISLGGLLLLLFAISALELDVRINADVSSQQHFIDRLASGAWSKGCSSLPTVATHGLLGDLCTVFGYHPGDQDSAVSAEARSSKVASSALPTVRNLASTAAGADHNAAGRGVRQTPAALTEYNDSTPAAATLLEGPAASDATAERQQTASSPERRMHLGVLIITFLALSGCLGIAQYSDILLVRQAASMGIHS